MNSDVKSDFRLVIQFFIDNLISSNMSVVSSRDRDCLLCRLVSGGGLIGAGAYVGYHSNSQSKTLVKTGMRGFAAGKITGYKIFQHLTVVL